MVSVRGRHFLGLVSCCFDEAADVEKDLTEIVQSVI